MPWVGTAMHAVLLAGTGPGAGGGYQPGAAHDLTCLCLCSVCGASVRPLLLLPAVAGVSFLWTVVLSVLRGAMEHAHQHQHLPEQGATAAVA